MRVQFIQSGGIVGAVRQCTLDTSAMADDEARTLEALVKNANLSTGERRAPAGRDLEEYEISIDDGHGTVTVVRDQSTLPQEAKALVAHLKKCARPASLT